MQAQAQIPPGAASGSGIFYGLRFGLLAHDLGGLWSHTRAEGGVDWNAEVVFNAAVFTKAAFMRDGRTEVLDFAASKMHPAHAAVLRPDTPWVTSFDEAKGVGFASLFRDLATPNLNGGQASLQQPFIYIQHGLWFYVSRGFVYSFGTNNQTRILPVAAGSVYYDRNAWIAYPYPKGEGLGDWLDARFNALRWPLAVHDDIET